MWKIRALRRIGAAATMAQERPVEPQVVLNQLFGGKRCQGSRFARTPGAPWRSPARSGQVRGKEIRHSVMGGTGDAAEDQENRDLDTTIFG